MGFIKKKKKDDQGTVVFKGDLAIIADPYTTELNKAMSNRVFSSEIYGPDSEDSIVFMTFYEVFPDKWECPECGTMIGNKMKNCVVCGYRRG